MGQSNTHTLSEENELLKVYAIEGRAKELNLTYLIHRQSQQSYLLREHIYNNDNEFKNILRRIEMRLQFRSANLTNLIKIEQFHEDNLCSKQYRIYSLWDYSKTTLCDQISQRALQKRAFSVHQLRSTVSQLAKGMLTLQKNKICHESITTKTILIQQPFTIKIVDPIAFPLQSNLEIVSLKRTVKNIYLSPEQCSLILKKTSHAQSDSFRSDMFTIGMIILECGLLQRQDQCYGQECGIVNWNNLQLNLRIFQEQYGCELKYILTNMLKPNPAERIDWYELENGLSRGNFGLPSNILKTSTIISDRPVRVSLPAPARSTIILSHAVPIKQPVNSNSFLLANNNPILKMPFMYRDPGVKLQNNGSLTNQITFTSRPIQRFCLREMPKRSVLNSQSLTQNQSTPNSIISEKPRNSNITSYARHIQPKPFNIDNQMPSFKQDKPARDINTLDLNLNDPIFIIEQLQHGSKYQGYKLKGQREGWGTFHFQDGGKFEGEWKENLMSGRGKLYYQSGRLAYEGDWLKDRFHGFGTLYNDNPEMLAECFEYSNFDQIDEYWISYQGEFKEDLKEGSGRLKLTNGEVFQGTFYHDTIDGQGTYCTLEGKKVHGLWRQNRFKRELDL